MPGIIASQNDLTPEWITGILRESGGISPDFGVASVEIDEDFATVGILSHVIRVSPTYTSHIEDAPRSLVVKLPSDDPVYIDICRSFSIYLREVNYYKTAAKLSPFISPRVFFAECDPMDSGRFTMVMEEVKGTPGEQLVGATLSQLNTAIEHLASHHARLWNAVDTSEFEWLPRPATPFIIENYRRLYPMGIDSSLRNFPEIYSAHSGSIEIAEALIDNISALSRTLSEAPQTIIHGDYKLDNLFFSCDTTDGMSVLDFQLCYKGRGAYDMAYLMTQSVDPDLRRDSEMDLIRRYHSILAESGIADYDFGACLKDYKRAALLCLMYPIIGGMGVDPKATDRVSVGKYGLIKVMLERCLRAIYDLGLEDLLEK